MERIGDTNERKITKHDLFDAFLCLTHWERGFRDSYALSFLVVTGIEGFTTMQFSHTYLFDNAYKKKFVLASMTGIAVPDSRFFTHDY